MHYARDGVWKGVAMFHGLTVAAALTFGFGSDNAAAEHELHETRSDVRPVVVPPDLSGPTPEEREAKQRGYFTDTLLTTQDGRLVRFYTDVLKGRVVLIHFIFTSCTDACPAMVQKMMAARAELGSEFAKDMRYVSISIDPQRDTPAELRNFAHRMGVVDPEWVFLTGSQENVDLIVKKLGAYTGEVENHSTVMIAGNVKADRWRKLSPTVSPKGIAQHLRSLEKTEILSAQPVLAIPATATRKD